jgi:hypothetical protein
LLKRIAGGALVITSSLEDDSSLLFPNYLMLFVGRFCSALVIALNPLGIDYFLGAFYGVESPSSLFSSEN